MARKRQDRYGELLDARESRDVLGISFVLWEALQADDMLPRPVKIATTWKWRKADLLQWVADRKPQHPFESASAQEGAK